MDHVSLFCNAHFLQDYPLHSLKPNNRLHAVPFACINRTA